jgi:hypothetical protein
MLIFAYIFSQKIPANKKQTRLKGIRKKAPFMCKRVKYYSKVDLYPG